MISQNPSSLRRAASVATDLGGVFALLPQDYSPKDDFRRRV